MCIAVLLRQDTCADQQTLSTEDDERALQTNRLAVMTDSKPSSDGQSVIQEAPLLDLLTSPVCN